MAYYEIYNLNGGYEIWKWTCNGTQGERFKFFKTKKAQKIGRQNSGQGLFGDNPFL